MGWPPVLPEMGEKMRFTFQLYFQIRQLAQEMIWEIMGQVPYLIELSHFFPRLWA